MEDTDLIVSYEREFELRTQFQNLHNLANGSISSSEFFEEFGMTGGEARSKAMKELRHVFAQGLLLQNIRYIEFGVTLQWEFEIEGFIDLAHEFVTETFHISNEHLISYLQDQQSPSSIPFLREAIEIKSKLGYFDYDDYGSYYKKCLWALTAIGTPEAKAVIEQYTNSPISELKAEAIYRLARFEVCKHWEPVNRLELEDTYRSREPKEKKGVFKWLASLWRS